VTVTVTNSTGLSGSLANAFTYLAPPTVSSVSPNSGSTAGGTSVTITGANFAAGATVTFGSAAATSVVVVSSTSITARTPAGSAGALTVTVTVSGQSGSLTNGFTYIVTPTVTSVSPNNGPTAGGTAVTITGANFAAGATVTFGSAAATNIVVVNSTTITATTSAGSAGAVTVTVTVNSQSGSLANGFTYVAPPTVTSVSPNSGSTAGGTAVTITGTNFAAGATATFGGTAATNVAVVNSTTITATTPAGSAGAVTVSVTVSGQSGSLASGFTYVVVPTVTSVLPNNGPVTGGTAVTITGANFATGATVTFGTAAATNVAVVNSTTITATTPAGSAGAVTVTVTVNSQSGSLTNGFAYVAPPTVTSVNPNTGTTSGGTAVTITGTNFATGATVTFGSTSATNVGVVNSTTITATTPAASAGAVTVTVTNLGSLSGSLANAYTYTTVPTPTAPTGLTGATGGPGPIYVNGQGYYNSTSLTSHTTASFDSTGGDTIILFASSHAGVTFTPSDNFGNTWIPISGPTSTVAGFDLRSEVWYARNPIVGPGHTITMNLSISQPLVMSIAALKGSNVSSPIDAISVIGSDNGTQTVNVATPNVSTASTNDLLIGFVKTNGTETFTAGTAFTLQSTATVLNLTAETGLATAPGTYDATFTLSSGVTWQSVIGGVASNPNQSSLSWTASTETGGTISQYFVERCKGTGCASFVQIGTTTGTTLNDTGLSAATSYSYRVRAEDTANNLGPYSSIVSVITPAAIPSIPGNITATTASSNQINLTWVASAENGGTVAEYLVQRCQGAGCTNFSQVGTTAGTAFNDVGLAPSTAYSYRVQAMDSQGNVGPSALASGSTASATASISFVQGNYATPQSAQTSVNVAFTAAQVAGDLNVIVVGWNNSTSTVTGVTDRSGNTYALAVGPTVQAPVASQSIYYAKNIAGAAAGANIVTVTFSSAAAYPDIRILEYSGADPNNSLDVTAANTGNGTLSSSGTATTTYPLDLIFGANLVQTITSGPGTGFTSRMVTQPDADIAEDEMVSNTGTYSTTAPLSSGQWIMQMVAFRTAAQPNSPLVNLSSGNINFGNVQTGIPSSPQPVTLTNMGSAQLNISSIAVSGGNSADFSQTNNCGTTLQVNASCTINITFTPTNTSARSSSIVITDNALGTPHTITVSGTGTGFTVTPGVSVLTFLMTQQFTASSGSATWSVDGVVGGSASTGTITASGFYTPPTAIGTHTITGTASSQSASSTVYITNNPGTFTHHNDNLRTGQNLNETVLTPANVNQNHFGKLFSYSLDGIAFASPLYVASVNIPGKGTRNVVYVATEHDSVYAFDAEGLNGSTPLWHVSFLSSGVTTVPCGDTGECGDIPTEIGITGTPVIDPSGGTIYLVAKTKEGSSTYVQRLHALDITTGAEKFGGPVVIQASAPGTGDGSNTVTFKPLKENQRTGLLLNNGIVYFGFGSHGDVSPWYGWILGYNATTLQQVLASNASPDGQGAGVWQSGGGLATDASGDIFFSTGNGDFNANTGGRDYGDSVVKVSPGGTVVDYFTPHDQATLSSTNIELGSAGPVLLLDQSSGPYPHLLITAGKNGTIYVVNRDNMGHYNPNNDSQIVQSLVNALPNSDADHGNYSSPAYFNGYVYFGAIGDKLRAFQLANGLLSTAPTSSSAEVYQVRGASYAISANGNSNGILWAIQNNGADPNNDTGAPGVLYAYDANNLANEFYNSSQAGSRDTMDDAAKFSIPLVVNGKVFIAGQTQLTAYGLLP